MIAYTDMTMEAGDIRIMQMYGRYAMMSTKMRCLSTARGKSIIAQVQSSTMRQPNIDDRAALTRLQAPLLISGLLPSLPLVVSPLLHGLQA